MENRKQIAELKDLELTFDCTIHEPTCKVLVKKTNAEFEEGKIYSLSIAEWNKDNGNTFFYFYCKEIFYHKGDETSRFFHVRMSIPNALQLLNDGVIEIVKSPSESETSSFIDDSSQGAFDNDMNLSDLIQAKIFILNKINSTHRSFYGEAEYELMQKIRKINVRINEIINSI